MPAPICPSCGATRKLDKETYLNYHGQVTCEKCFERMHVQIDLSTLSAEVTPAIERDLQIPPEVASQDVV